jgi:hypothetical protein
LIKALYILKQYEEEINYIILNPADRQKGKYFRFNKNVILRTDGKSQAEIIKQYVQNDL